MLGEVAIAIIEGQGDEGAGIRLAEPPDRLGQRDEIEAERPRARQGGIEEGRLDLQQAVGGEAAAIPRRADVVEGEDGPAAARQRRQCPVQPGRAKDGEAGADHPSLARSHALVPPALQWLRPSLASPA